MTVYSKVDYFHFAMIDAQEIGFRILVLRRRRKLTQRQVAQAAGLNALTVHRIEHGSNAEVDSLNRIAEALGVSLSQLIDGQQGNAGQDAAS